MQWYIGGDVLLPTLPSCCSSQFLEVYSLKKPFGQLAAGILAMLLSCLVFLRLLLCLRKEECLQENQGVTPMNSMQNWSLVEKFVVAVIVILIVSMGSSSMVEEEQYIWHFLTSTLFWILLCKTIQLFPIGGNLLNWAHCRSRYSQLSSLLVILVSGRIIRGWHQGGVNWTHLPDISKWLEQAGGCWIRAFKLLSGILLTNLSLFAFSTVAALYFMGMAGHFGLGNSNTLATIDVAGAFIGISNHSTMLSEVLMFCITYASPMLMLLSLVMYISFKDGSHSRVYHTMDLGLLLKSVLAIPLLVPLCINSVLLIAYTIVLLLMRNHLFIWSVFSPKYLYVCATTACVYVGLCIVAVTQIYIFLVCAFRSRRLVSAINGAEGVAVGQ